MNHVLDDVVKVYNENFSDKNKIVWEVGSRDGLDGYEVALRIGVEDFNNLYFVEANPNQAVKIKEIFPNSHLFNVAVSDFEGEADFALFSRPNGDMGAVGCSSLRLDWLDVQLSNDPTLKREIIKVKVTKLSNLIDESKVDKIDVMLVDVEGAALEVLEGLGNNLYTIKVIQVETELDKNTDRVIDFMTERGFELYPNKEKWDGHADLVFINRN